jgi:hypothetical protein
MAGAGDLPATWQGWVSLLVFVALLIAGVFLFPPAQGPLAFLLYTLLATFAFGLVCYAKGEPPAWHWGEK